MPNANLFFPRPNKLGLVLQFLVNGDLQRRPARAYWARNNEALGFECLSDPAPYIPPFQAARSGAGHRANFGPCRKPCQDAGAFFDALCLQ